MAYAYDDQNIFAKILRREIPNSTVMETEYTLAFNDIALVTYPDQVRHAHQLERAPHGIYPEGVGVDGVTHSDVPSNPLIKTKFAKNTERRR